MAFNNAINCNTPGIVGVSAAGVFTGTAMTQYELLVGGASSSTVAQIAVGTAGQVLVSNGAGSNPSFQAVPGTFTWVDVATGTQTIAASTGYVTDNATTVTYTLPATAVLGDTFKILGGVSGAGGWTIAQNANQAIHFGTSTTITGAGGSLSSTNQFDNVECVAIVAGASTIWEVVASTGNLTVV